MKDLSERFFADAAKIETLNDQALHRSYREFVSFFASKKELTEHDVVIGAYFTYGWMPTMLDLRGDLSEITAIANRVKKKEEIDDKSLWQVAQAINGSIVGASKFLHFINPEQHAVWDSRVYRYLHQKHPYQYRLESPGAYWDYLNRLEALSSDDRFPDLKSRIEAFIGYEISQKRAGELVMFYHGSK